MRKLGRFGPMLGRAEIGGIQIDVKSRDDIPAILLGLQGLYLNEALREAIFELLLDRFGEDCDLKVGRPGMELWTVLVLAVLKQGLGCDFDRLREHANTHVVLRQLLGHSELEPVTYSYDQEPLAKLPYEQIFLAVFWRAIDGTGATPGGIM